MTNANNPIGPDSHQDPTIKTLIPESSRWRNTVLAGIGLLLLVAAWASPITLRPIAIDAEGGGVWSALPPHHQVVTVVDLDPQGWPSFTLQSVADVPGTTAVASWVVRDGDFGWDSDSDASEYASGLDYLLAQGNVGDLEAANRLPQRLDSDDSGQLVTLWDITDCARLVEGMAPEVELRSLLRIASHEVLPTIASPGFDFATLAEVGICP